MHISDFFQFQVTVTLSEDGVVPPEFQFVVKAFFTFNDYACQINMIA